MLLFLFLELMKLTWYLQVHTILNEIVFGGQVLETSSDEVMRVVEEITRLHNSFPPNPFLERTLHLYPSFWYYIPFCPSFMLTGLRNPPPIQSDLFQNLLQGDLDVRKLEWHYFWNTEGCEKSSFRNCKCNYWNLCILPYFACSFQPNTIKEIHISSNVKIFCF